MQRLADRHLLIAPDQVGFGLSTRHPTRPLRSASYADRLADLLTELGVASAHVVGLSWGGGIAQRLAIAHPERVERLVLLASVNAAWTLRFGDRDLIGLILGRLAPPVARRMVRRYLAGSAGDQLSPSSLDRLADGYVEALRRPDTIRVMRRFVRATRASQPVDPAAITAPTLVIVGSRDRIVPPGIGSVLASTIPGARLETLEGLGHDLEFSGAPRLAELIAEFVQDPAPGATS